MNTSNKNITFKGNPIEVSGNELSVGSIIPDFTLTGNDLSPVTISNFSGKKLIISVIPSLDTPICSVQTKRFNEEISKLGDEVAVLTVSRDLPFAQKRWCAAENATNVVTASDYKERTFGKAFGVDIESLGILARAIFVVAKDGKITHLEYVPEIGQEPDYEAAISALN